MTPLFGIGEGLFSPSHMIILLVIGILVFGKRLPEIGRMLGKGITEFKKGMAGLEDNDLQAPAPTAAARPPQQLTAEPIRPPQRVTPTAPAAPKFEDAAPTSTPPTA